MHQFLLQNRDELIARCKLKAAERPRRAATMEQLANGVPLFLSQLIRTLQAEDHGEHAKGIRISGPAGGDATALSEIGLTATAPGKQLPELGYSVDQVDREAKRRGRWWHAHGVRQAWIGLRSDLEPSAPRVEGRRRGRARVTTTAAGEPRRRCVAVGIVSDTGSNEGVAGQVTYLIRTSDWFA